MFRRTRLRARVPARSTVDSALRHLGQTERPTYAVTITLPGGRTYTDTDTAGTVAEAHAYADGAVRAVAELTGGVAVSRITRED